MITLIQNADKRMSSLIQKESVQEHYSAVCHFYGARETLNFITHYQIIVTKLGIMMAELSADYVVIDKFYPAAKYLCKTILDNDELLTKLNQLQINDKGNAEKHDIYGKSNNADIDTCVSVFNQIVKGIENQYDLHAVHQLLIAADYTDEDGDVTPVGHEADFDAENSEPAPVQKPSASKQSKKGTGQMKQPPSKGTKSGKATPPAVRTDVRPADRTEPPKPSKKRRFSEYYMPYLLGALGLFLTVSLILDVIGKAETPNDHLMGFVGYYLCYFLFGVFGAAAFLLPVVVFTMAIAWRKYSREHLVGVQIALSVSFIIILSGFIHVCLCESTASSGADALGLQTDFITLYMMGKTFTSGGVIGGYLGWLMYHGLRFAGSLVLAIVVLPLLFMSIAGVTPAFVFTLIKAKWIEWMHAARVRREERKLARAERKAREAAEAAMQDEYDRADDEAPAKEPSYYAASRKPVLSERAAAEARAVWVDPLTGEVLKEGGKRKPSEKPKQQSVKKNVTPQDNDDYSDLNEEDVLADTVSSAGTTADDSFLFDDEEENDGTPVKIERSSLGETGNAGSGQSDGSNTNPVDPASAASVQSTQTGRKAGETDTVQNMSVKTNDEVIVRVLQSDKTALVSTADNPVDGLPDEPTGAGDSTVVSKSAPADDGTASNPYVYPPIDLLTKSDGSYEADPAEIAKNTRILRDTLESFRIRVREIECSCGPTVTRFEVKPDTGIRVRAISNLVDDIALNLAKSGVRIEAPIPGKSAVGIEVPNDKPATVYLRNLLETPEFKNHKSKLASCLGAEVSGKPIIFDINKMPHLLVSGTTGSGKSVCINCIILSLLYKATPQEVQLILIDPKKVEFNMYRNIPHLKTPIVTNPKKAAGALYAAVEEMEWRFNLIEQVGVRNLAGYNEVTAGDPEHPPMPQLVIIIDELADLMMTAPTDVENAICRLAQKGRAAGIHLILGTQRPSVDVITGLIKANVPSRIAFTVKSQIDSRTIIDVTGAEKLIGRGDMLYAPVGSVKPLRVQGAFVSDSEVEAVVDFIKEHNDPPEFSEEFADQIEMEAARCGNGKKKSEDSEGGDFDALGSSDGGDEDSKFWEALEVAVNAEKVSTSLLQRRANIGYGRAAKIIDRMEDLGYVGPADGNKPRKLLITAQQFAELKANGFKK